MGDAKEVAAWFRGHAGDPEACVTGCLQLLDLSQSMDTAQQVLEEGGHACIADSMRIHQGNIKLQTAACKALDKLSYLAATECASVGAALYVTVAVSKNQDQLELLRHGMATLCHMANVGASLKRVWEEGAPSAVLTTMRSHPGERKMQWHGCLTLHNLARAAAPQMVEAGAAAAVVAAMRAHPGDEDVQQTGAQAIWTMAKAPGCAKAVADAGCVAVVLSGMRDHPGDKKVQYHGCSALTHMTTAVAHAVADAGGASAMVAAMRAHPKDLDVQRSGCAALYYLAKDLSQVVHDAGGPAAVMTAMAKHPSEVSVIQPGCAVMYCCATVAAKPVTDIGGAGSVVAAMRAHPGTLGVQRAGCGALHTLACDPACRQRVIDEGGVQALLRAAAAHPKDDMITKAAKAEVEAAKQASDAAMEALLAEEEANPSAKASPPAKSAKKKAKAPAGPTSRPNGQPGANNGGVTAMADAALRAAISGGEYPALARALEAHAAEGSPELVAEARTVRDRLKQKIKKQRAKQQKPEILPLRRALLQQADERARTESISSAGASGGQGSVDRGLPPGLTAHEADLSSNGSCPSSPSGRVRASRTSSWADDDGAEDEDFLSDTSSPFFSRGKDDSDPASPTDRH